jgi:hypothetical protein
MPTVHHGCRSDTPTDVAVTVLLVVFKVLASMLSVQLESVGLKRYAFKLLSVMVLLVVAFSASR